MRGKCLITAAPVILCAGCIALAVGCATTGAPPASAGSSGISGRVVMKDTGDPVEGAYVYAYHDWGKNLMGVSDFLSRGTAADGRYRLELPPGKYGVVARRREKGASYGPLSTGDDFDNRAGLGPVTVEPGRFTGLDFALIRMREPMFFKRNPEEATDTGVKGRIIDEKGAPLPGAFAIAYTGPDMKRIPEYASTLTNDDGRFVLYLPAGGKYYLGARVHIKDMPKPGEPYGAYEGSADHSLVVEKGRFIEGIDLIVRPFAGSYRPDFSPY